MHDDYNQYKIAIEQVLCMESTNVATALFHLVASHYVFNLSYHDKIQEVLCFIQEKVTGITQEGGINREGKTSCRSPVVVSHINGITNKYQSLSRGEFETETVSDSD